MGRDLILQTWSIKVLEAITPIDEAEKKECDFWDSTKELGLLVSCQDLHDSNPDKWDPHATLKLLQKGVREKRFPVSREFMLMGREIIAEQLSQALVRHDSQGDLLRYRKPLSAPPAGKTPPRTAKTSYQFVRAQ